MNKQDKEFFDELKKLCEKKGDFPSGWSRNDILLYQLINIIDRQESLLDSICNKSALGALYSVSLPQDKAEIDRLNRKIYDIEKDYESLAKEYKELKEAYKQEAYKKESITTLQNRCAEQEFFVEQLGAENNNLKAFNSSLIRALKEYSKDSHNWYGTSKCSYCGVYSQRWYRKACQPGYYVADKALSREDWE